MELTLEQRQQFHLTRIFDELRVNHLRLASVFGHDPQLFYQHLLKLQPRLEQWGKVLVFHDDAYLPLSHPPDAFPCIYLNQAQVMHVAQDVRWPSQASKLYRVLLENFQLYEEQRWSNLPCTPVTGLVHADSQDRYWFEPIAAPQCRDVMELFLGHICGELGLSLKPEQVFGLFLMKFVCPAWLKRRQDNYAQLDQLREKLLF